MPRPHPPNPAGTGAPGALYSRRAPPRPAWAPSSPPPRVGANRMEHNMAQRPTPRLESTGAGRDPTATPPFGISRSPSQRLELVFALRNGGMITAAHDMGAPVTAETLDRFCAELRQAIGAGSDWREF